MPQASERNVGVRMKVPEGLKATCVNGHILVTVSTDVAVAHADVRGDKSIPTGYICFWLRCPRCNRPVKFRTNIKAVY